MRFRFAVRGPDLRRQVGAPALAIIHALEHIAKRHNGKAWPSVAWLVANARTQDGRPLSPKQVRTGIYRAERAGLISPGMWGYRRRAGQVIQVYIRELLCWPDPRGQGRCYGMTYSASKKVNAMTTHGGKRAGAGRKVGTKDAAPEQARERRKAAQKRRFWPDEATDELLAESRRLDAANPATDNQVLVNQVGTTHDQVGTRTLSRRDREKAVPSYFVRKNAAVPAAVVSLPSETEPKGPPISDLVERDPECGICVMPPPPGLVWQEPRHLMPPFPTTDRFPVAMTPNPPKLPDDMPDADRLVMLSRAYRGAVRAVFKHAPPVRRGSFDIEPKLRPKLLQCALALQDQDISPAAWALFSCEVWRENNSKRRPAPMAWVWLESRVDTHHGWFRHGWRGNDIGRRLVFGEAIREVMARWKSMVDDLRAVRAATADTVAPIVERWFPDDTYNHLRERAAFEAKRTQRELEDKAKSGEWIW